MSAPHSPTSPEAPSLAHPVAHRVGLWAPPALHAGLSDLLTIVGLEVTEVSDVDDGGAGAPDTPVIAVWSGWPPAHATDAWLRDPRPHLVVAVGASQVRMGPFVDPGLTACLRCLEAAGTLRGDEMGPAPTSAAELSGVLALAGALAAHDIQRWYAGRVPATWSATLTLDARLDTSRRTWLRHPHCGCSWGLAAEPV